MCNRGKESGDTGFAAHEGIVCVRIIMLPLTYLSYSPTIHFLSFTHENLLVASAKSLYPAAL